MAISKDKVIAAAQKYVEKAQYDKAIREYQKVIQEDPRDVRVWHKIGDLHVKRNATKEAIETYEKVASIYSEQGFYFKAVAVYKQILKMDSRRIDINLRLAELYKQLGLLSDAMQQFEMAANNYAKEGKSRESLEALKQVVDLEPDNIASRIKLAESYSKEGMATEAVAEFSHAAEQLKAQKRLEDWIKVAERIAWHKPDDHALLKELASLYIRRSDSRRALTKLQACFKSNPRDVMTLELLAEAFQDLGQHPKTLSVLRELAKVHHENQDFEHRNEVYRRILALEPEDAEAKAALGMDRKVPRPSAASSASRPSPGSAASRMGAPGSSSRMMAEPSSSRLGSASSRIGAPEPSSPRMGAVGSSSRIEPPSPSRVSPAPRGNAMAGSPITKLPAGRAPNDMPVADLEELDLGLVAGPSSSHQPEPYGRGRAEMEPDEDSEQTRFIVDDVRPAAFEEEDASDAIEIEPEEVEIGEDYGLPPMTLDQQEVEAEEVEVVGDDYDSSVAVVLEGNGHEDAIAASDEVEVFAEEAALLAPEAAPAEAEAEDPDLVFDDPEGFGSDELDAGSEVDLSDLSDREATGRRMGVERHDTAEMSRNGRVVHGQEVAELEEEAPPSTDPQRELAALDRPDISDDLDEADFFLQQGLAEQAREILDGLLAQHPGHPLVLGKLAEVDALAEREKPAPPPSTVDESRLEQMAAQSGLLELSRRAVTEKQIGEEDFETHYDLGIAYKEMGLYDDAIHEFQMVMKAPGKAVTCHIMMGLCFSEKGLQSDAIGHFKRGLYVEGISEREQLTLYYELGASYEKLDDIAEALYYFEKVTKKDPKFRDLEARIARLKARDAKSVTRPNGGAVPAVHRDDVDDAFAGLISGDET